MASEKTKKQRGASMIEYALLVALIALIAVAGVKGFGITLGGTIDKATYNLNTASGNVCDPQSPNYNPSDPQCAAF